MFVNRLSHQLGSRCFSAKLLLVLLLALLAAICAMGGPGRGASLTSVSAAEMADVKIVSQTLVAPPTEIVASQDVGVTLRKAFHNNGPLGPVNVSISVQAVAPAGCTATASPANPTSATLPVSTAVTVDEVWTIHCNLHSTHSFSFNNSISVTTPGISDPVPSNNSDSTPLSVDVIGQADVKISGQSLLSPPATIAQNVAVDVTLRKTVHNNGPAGPANVSITNTANLTLAPGCTATPKPTNPMSASLPVSTAVTVDEVWTVRCSTTGNKTFRFDNSIAVTDPHVMDPNVGSNSGSTSLSVNVTTSFNPSFSTSLSNNSPGAHGAITTSVRIPDPGPYYDALVTFTPPEFFVARAGDVPIGAHVADLYFMVTLTPLSSIVDCNIPVAGSLDLLNASVDTMNTGSPDWVHYYPPFLNTVFPGVTPRARMYGWTTIAGAAFPFNVVVFEPGTALPGLPSFDPSLGYPSVVITGDPTVWPVPFGVDACAPLRADLTVFGTSRDNPDTPEDESGATVRTNPVTSGVHMFDLYIRSRPDEGGHVHEQMLESMAYLGGGPILVALDMDPTGNSCPGDGIHDCGLGAIDTCVNTSPGASFQFDVVVAGLPPSVPERGQASIDVQLQWGGSVIPPQADVIDITARAAISPLIHYLQQAPGSDARLGDPHVLPRLVPPYVASVSDVRTEENNPPISKGTGWRGTATVSASAAPGLYRLEFRDWPFHTIIGNVIPYDECWDGPGCTLQNAIIAVGQACPGAGPDADGDTIPDAHDACPDEPEDLDEIDDADGCPEALGRDAWADMGNPDDEGYHNRRGGWGDAQGPPDNPYVSPSGDDTKRYLRPWESSYIDLYVPRADEYYALVAEVEDGYCDDTFRAYVNGFLAINYYATPSVMVRALGEWVPRSVVHDTTVTVEFVNRAVDNCGRAPVFNVRLVPIQSPPDDPDGDLFIGSADDCPNEAEDFNEFQDEDGCPENPDVAITELDFYNFAQGYQSGTEPPPDPNELTIRAKLSNLSSDWAESVRVKALADGQLIGGDDVWYVEPQGTRQVDIKWTPSGNVEHATIEVGAELLGDEDANPSNNTLTKDVAFYFVDFRHDRDAFSFQNWSFESFGDYLDELHTVYGSNSVTRKAKLFLGGYYASFLGSAGHCYGMATSSAHWYLSPDKKPLAIDTYDMSLEESDVEAAIVEHHWYMLVYLLQGLTERLAGYNAAEQYQRVVDDLKRGNPVVLAMWDDGLKEGHSVTAFSVLDLGNEKRVYVYDNNVPLRFKIGDNYALYNVSEQDITYDNLHKVLAVPLGYALLPGSLSGLVQSMAEVTAGSWDDQSALLWVHSPVSVIATDQFGRRIGTVGGAPVNEIPGADMQDVLGSHVFYLPRHLSYSVTMIGLDNGTVAVDVVVPTSEKTTSIVSYSSVPVAPNAEISMTLDPISSTYQLTLESGEVAQPSETAGIDFGSDVEADLIPDGLDNCPTVANPDQADVESDGIGDACDHSDGDGFVDALELYLGTDPGDACSHPLDINGDRAFSVTGDVINFVGRIGAAPGDDNWWQRLDLDMSGDISVTGDVAMYVGRIGEMCR